MDILAIHVLNFLTDLEKMVNLPPSREIVLKTFLTMSHQYTGCFFFISHAFLKSHLPQFFTDFEQQTHFKYLCSMRKSFIKTVFQ